MNNTEYIYNAFGVSQRASLLIEDAQRAVEDKFKEIEAIAEFNQLKVMRAFADNKVSERHFMPTTGYGYDDDGRDTLDKIYAQVFGAEDALVRHNWVNGSHTLATMLYGVLRPGDTMLAITGKPYDTLEEVIGIAGKDGNGSLKDFGVKYKELELINGDIDYENAEKILKTEKIRAVMIQRSKGYGWRPTYSAEKIGDIVKFVKSISPDTVCMVDNCYGEFADIYEPTDFGADLIAGSLIKNPGGGLAPTGGYIAGRRDLVELCSYRMTCVGIGRECGATLGFNRQAYQGLFMAPHTVLQALKAAILCASAFSILGFETDPAPNGERHDIIQSVKFGDKDKMIAFIQGIQKGAPIDSFVVPEPWDMPGYQDQVIMAAGAFIQGASIELSADAPIREPYIAYMQGGLTYESAKLGITVAVDNILKLDD
ncbi:MAG: methionine gamma-lyase family protein [Clostridiales bacterium]|nr:methionine gamma-lyase family protein [Clostridiales bacterium]